MIKKSLITLAILTTVNAEEMPIHAKAGQCFTKTFYPSKYTNVTNIKSTKRVLLNEESVKYDVVPAKFSWKNERIKISDGHEKLVVIPAKYKSVRERILVEDEYKVWRKGLGPNSPKAFNSCLESAHMAGMDFDTIPVGSCFYEHFKPAKYETVLSKILVSEASERIEVIPAKYRTVTKKILIDGTSIKLLSSKPVYKNIKDRVEVRPAKTEWRKTICNNKGCNQSEVVCLVEVPVKYKKITRRVVLQPAIGTKNIPVKPKYKTIKIEELLTPASERVIPIPAKYMTISKKNRIENEKYFWSNHSNTNESSQSRSQCDKICLTVVPAKYKTVTKKVLLSPPETKRVSTKAQYTVVKIKEIEQKEYVKKVIIPAEYINVIVEKEKTKSYAKWMPMVCEEQLTPKIIKSVQLALTEEGLYTAVIDGILSMETKSAIREYQKRQGLAVTHKLSIETMISLGIN